MGRTYLYERISPHRSIFPRNTQAHARSKSPHDLLLRTERREIQSPVVFRIRPLARRHSNFQYERLGFTSERSQRRHMPFSSPRQ